MSRVASYLLPVLILVNLANAYGDEQSAALQSHEAKFLETDDAYQPPIPTAPDSIPGRSGKSTPEEIELNEKYLNHPDSCHFVGDDVSDDDFKQSFKRVILNKDGTPEVNAASMLKQCNALETRIKAQQELPCSVLVLGGHASSMSLGLGNIFGIKAEKNKWVSYPAGETFDKLVQCFKGITRPTSPIIFTTCGGGSVYDDFMVESMRKTLVFFPNKKEVQDLFSTWVDRTVISANGPENRHRWGKHSRYGWYRATPNPLEPVNSAGELVGRLPVIKQVWSSKGLPLIDLKGFSIEKED